MIEEITLQKAIVDHDEDIFHALLNLQKKLKIKYPNLTSGEIVDCVAWYALGFAGVGIQAAIMFLDTAVRSADPTLEKIMEDQCTYH
jgi:hypothetical protein